MKEINKFIDSLNLSPKEREAKRYELAHKELEKFREDRKAGKLSSEEIEAFQKRKGLWYYGNPRNKAHFDFYSNGGMNRIDQLAKMISGGKNPSKKY